LVASGGKMVQHILNLNRKITTKTKRIQKHEQKQGKANMRKISTNKKKKTTATQQCKNNNNNNNYQQQQPTSYKNKEDITAK